MNQLEMFRHHRQAIENTPAKTDRQRLDKKAALVAIDKMIAIAEAKTCEFQPEHSGESKLLTTSQG